MIPRLRPNLTHRELAAALRMPGRNDVERFEAAFAEEMGQNHALAFPLGRTGLLMLLQALDLKDAEIICPAYTCVVVAHAIVLSGNRPVFVDCEPDGFNMSLELAEAAITPKTKALIATSLFGYPVNLDQLAALRARHPGIRIIQDCAHSFAAEWNGKPVQQAGDAAIFGLNISKLMTSVFGGMVTTNDAALAERLRGVRDSSLKPASLFKSISRFVYLLAVYPAFTPLLYPVVHALQKSGALNRLTQYYDESKIDMPAGYLETMTPIEARVGLVQTQRYRELIEARRRRAGEWRKILSGQPGLTLPPEAAGATYSHFVCLVDNRRDWQDRWMQKSVELGELIEYSIPEMTAYQPFRRAPCTQAASYAGRTINFPLGSDIA